MSSQLSDVLNSIDAVNAADIVMHQDEDGRDVPEAQLYGLRMSAELERLFGTDVPDVLKIAARGQHIERWMLKRTQYPEGRTGYLTWRKDQARAHGDRLAGLMQDAGYDDQDCERVGVLLRKEGLKRDADVQMLEDVICFVFLTWYFGPFAAKHPEDKVLGIVSKTARKMSADARARALQEFDLPETLADAVKSAA
ncbi:MAG: DUF4202 domain-containing protein [Aliishimia sp.]